MQIGVDSFGAVISNPATGSEHQPSPAMDNLLDEIILAEQVGLDVFGIGEHHRKRVCGLGSSCDPWCGRNAHQRTFS